MPIPPPSRRPTHGTASPASSTATPTARPVTGTARTSAGCSPTGTTTAARHSSATPPAAAGWRERDPMSEPLRLLRSVFGYDSFRGAQADIVGHVQHGGDALVLMPTGGGKSLCYQLPSLLR